MLSLRCLIDNYVELSGGSCRFKPIVESRVQGPGATRDVNLLARRRWLKVWAWMRPVRYREKRAKSYNSFLCHLFPFKVQSLLLREAPSLPLEE